MSIAFNLIHLAAMESKEIALEEAQKIQDALEVLTAAGSPLEITAASFLLANVNKGITEILEGSLVTVLESDMAEYVARHGQSADILFNKREVK
jgi:hypothetical protein